MKKQTQPPDSLIPGRRLNSRQAPDAGKDFTSVSGAIPGWVQRCSMSKATPVKKAKPATGKQQYAALPIRVRQGGDLEVLLLTSRDTGRWIIPKGWPGRRLTARAAAAREAYEEAGIEGIIQPPGPVGRYHYAKRLEIGEIRITVKVFLLHVERQLDTWPEKTERETRWLSPEQAASMVDEPELAAILLSARDLAGWGES
jgi:8-oxo-dGTP pyrophosphatase MutT (NUDIX family)